MTTFGSTPCGRAVPSSAARRRTASLPATEWLSHPPASTTRRSGYAARRYDAASISRSQSLDRMQKAKEHDERGRWPRAQFFAHGVAYCIPTDRLPAGCSGRSVSRPLGRAESATARQQSLRATDSLPATGSRRAPAAEHHDPASLSARLRTTPPPALRPGSPSPSMSHTRAA